MGSCGKTEQPCIKLMSTEERKRYFIDYFAGHPYLTNATYELQEYIMDSISEDEPLIIYVVGPSGAGKTTLINKTVNVFREYSTTQLAYSQAHIPIVKVEAIAPDNGTFDFKDHYRRTLIELREPLISNKIDCSLQDAWRDIGRINIKPNSQKLDFRQALENAFIHRKVLVNIIDEAQHIGAVSSGRKLEDHIKAMKSLVNTSGVTMVLVGTHNLLDIYGLDGQLTRRSRKVILPRYDIHKKGDEENFQGVLYQFIERLPFSEKDGLIDNWEFFYERSIGCIGILKLWMNRTVNRVLRDGKESIKIKDFETSAHTAKECRKMLREAKEGEERLADTEEDLKVLRNGLGLTEDISINNNEEDTVNDTQKEKRKKAVGKRDPVRDPVGVIIDDVAVL